MKFKSILDTEGQLFSLNNMDIKVENKSLNDSCCRNYFWNIRILYYCIYWRFRLFMWWWLILTVSSELGKLGQLIITSFQIRHIQHTTIIQYNYSLADYIFVDFLQASFNLLTFCFLRSCCLQMFCKIYVLKNFTIFTGKH